MSISMSPLSSNESDNDDDDVSLLSNDDDTWLLLVSERHSLSLSFSMSNMRRRATGSSLVRGLN